MPINQAINFTSSVRASEQLKNIKLIIENFQKINLNYIKDVEVYYKDLAEVILGLINQATGNIKLSVYILQEPKIINAIKKAASKNIAITILADLKTLDNCLHLFKGIKNIQVYESNRNFLISHDKYLIIDNKLSCICTGNLDGHLSSGSSRDFVFITKNKGVVDNLLSIFDFDVASNIQQARTTVNETLVFNNNGLLWGNGSIDNSGSHVDYPRNSNNNMLICTGSAYYGYLKHIRSAKKSIRLYMMVFNKYELAQELINASKRGVQVQIICQHLGASSAKLHTFMQEIFEAHNIEIYTNQGKLPYIHAKVCIVDNEIAISGSTNFSYASLYLNRELNICVSGPIVNTLAQQFDADWKLVKNHKSQIRRYKNNILNIKSRGGHAKTLHDDTVVSELII